MNKRKKKILSALAVVFGLAILVGLLLEANQSIYLKRIDNAAEIEMSKIRNSDCSKYYRNCSACSNSKTKNTFCTLVACMPTSRSFYKQTYVHIPYCLDDPAHEKRAKCLQHKIAKQHGYNRYDCEA